MCTKPAWQRPLADKFTDCFKIVIVLAGDHNVIIPK